VRDELDESGVHEDTGGNGVEDTGSDGSGAAPHRDPFTKSETNGHSKGSADRVEEGTGPGDPGVGGTELSR
jgi:hypothetical protein